MTERLRQLLREAEPEPEPLPLDGIRDRVRRTRRTRAGLVAALTAVVAAAVIVPLTVLPGPSHEAVLTATPTPSGVPTTRVVGDRHVSVTVPPGWSTGKPPLCGDVAEHMVTLGPFDGRAVCPDAPHVETGVGVVFEDLDASTSSPPVIARWAGQPARTTSTTHTGLDISGAPVTVTTETVSLPLLDAQVTVQARTPAEAAALLDRVSVHPATSLDLPTAASSLKVSVIATSRPSHQPDVTTTQAPLISAVLRALRAAPLLPTSTPICNVDAALPVALLTIPGRPTIKVRLGGCNEVVVGNGTLARATLN